TQEAFAAKKTSTSALWERQFEENRKREEAKLDARLRTRAAALSKKVILNQDRYEVLNLLGAAGLAPTTGGHLNVILPVVETCLPWAATVYRQRPPGFRIQPLHADDDPAFERRIVEDGEFFQTYFPTKEQLLPLEASDTLGGLLWKLDKETRSKVDESGEFFDEPQLKSGQKVRRVTVRATVTTMHRGVVVDGEKDFRDRAPPPPKAKGFGGGWYPPLPPPGEDRAIRFQQP